MDESKMTNGESRRSKRISTRRMERMDESKLSIGERRSCRISKRNSNCMPTLQKETAKKLKRTGGAKDIGEQMSVDMEIEKDVSRGGSKGSGSGSRRRSPRKRVLADLNYSSSKLSRRSGVKARSSPAVSVGRGSVEVYKESGLQVGASQTTIFVVKTDDFIVMGADSRTTCLKTARIIDKDYPKVRRLVDNVFLLISGEIDFAENILHEATELLEGQQPNDHMVQTAARCVSDAVNRRVIATNRRDIDIRYIVCGVSHAPGAIEGDDPLEFQIYRVFKYRGSRCKFTEKPRECSEGSGSPYVRPHARRFREDMTEEEAIDLVFDGLQSGAMSDWASGGYLRVVSVSRLYRRANILRLREPFYNANGKLEHRPSSNPFVVY